MGNQSNKNEEVGLGWDNPPLGAIFCYQSFVTRSGDPQKLQYLAVANG